MTALPIVLALFMLTIPAFAQVVAGTNAVPVATRLTLAEAEQIAIQAHPRLSSAKLLAGAARSVVVETKAAFYPAVTGAVTGAEAERGSTLAAGNLTTSSLFSRLSGGIYLSQLITDFGRTTNLTQTAQLRADAQDRNVDLTRAQIRLRVQQAYFHALQAKSVLIIAQQTVEARRLTLRRVSALAQSQLKSTLDVSFADVNLSEAELTLYRAENEQQASSSELAAAIGSEPNASFELLDEPMPDPLQPDVNLLIAEALKERPDLAAMRLSREAAQRFAEAERRLRFPSVNILGAAGALPVHDTRLQEQYTAAALNVTIPVFNGRAFSARSTEAGQRAQAVAKDVQDLEIQISRDVRIAWLNSASAARRLDVTAKLVNQAALALRLAQSRYELGLSAIIELNQAELNKTAADIENAAARYDYQLQRSALNFVIGALR